MLGLDQVAMMEVRRIIVRIYLLTLHLARVPLKCEYCLQLLSDILILQLVLCRLSLCLSFPIYLVDICVL